MVHILVFLIKAIVKAINANSATTTRAGQNTSSINSSGVSRTASMVYPKSTVGQSDNRGIAVVLALLTSFCCSISFFSNIILAIILKKSVHILLAIALLIGAIGIIYSMDLKKKEQINLLPSIEFDDTLHLQLSTEDHVKLEITNYLEDKYQPWTSGSFSSDDKEKVARYINLMTSDLYFYTFDILEVDSTAVESMSLYNVMNDEIEEEETIVIDPTTLEEETISEEYHVKSCSAYLPTDVMQEQFKFNNDKLKDCIVTARMKEDKSQYVFIIGIILIFIIALFQSLYLWISFFKSRNKHNPSNSGGGIDTHHYKPEVTINSQTATSKRVEASSHSPKAVETINVAEKSHKLDMNTIDIYQFLAIPVMTYSQALLIIAERNDKGKYLDMEDLTARNNLDPKISEALMGRIYFS